MLRDRETTQASSVTCLATNERLYALHDFFNTTGVVNTSGTVLERYGYDAYGISRVMDANFGSRANSSYVWEARYGAYHWDGETGLYHVRNRFLHPKLGRWIARDPVEYQNGINLYEYAYDNPMNLIDPNGTNSCDNSYLYFCACTLWAALVALATLSTFCWLPILGEILAVIAFYAAQQWCCNGFPPLPDDGPLA